MDFFTKLDYAVDYTIQRTLHDANAILDISSPPIMVHVEWFSENRWRLDIEYANGYLHRYGGGVFEYCPTTKALLIKSKLNHVD